MNVFKRIGLFLVGVAGIVSLATLCLPWFGPWTKLATAMMTAQWYLYLIMCTAGITLLGSIISLGRALLTPHNAKTVMVSKSNGDAVMVSTAAIASQAAHIVEQDHEYFAEKVTVTARGRGHVKVAIRVRPAHAINITEEGQRLHDRLVDGLSGICGKALDRVELEFVEPDSLDPKPSYLNTSSSTSAGSLTASSSWTASSTPHDAEYEEPQDITVLMPTATPIDEQIGGES